MENLSTSLLGLTSGIPGYGIFSQILLQQFGIDVRNFVSTCLIIFALYQVGQYTYHWLYDFLLSYCTSYIEIDDWDTLYNHLLDWASAHQMTKLSRELKAVTFDSSLTSTTSILHDKEDKFKQIDDDDLPNTTGLFNFQKWHSNNPLIYKPDFSKRYFSHNGYLFHWTSGRRASLCNQQGYDQFVVLRCFGRSAKPIKDLLHEIKGFTLTKEIMTTEVYRSSIKAEVGQWLRQSIRPSRPVCTVSLDDEQKARVVANMNEYLQPATERWYAMRGIPYRRGYLFHGPPGTGKTSLSFALAGLFGLSIYCVSLGDTVLTESHLATLFQNLPSRCIVLLEDIDVAGLHRGSEDLDTGFSLGVRAKSAVGTDIGAPSKGRNQNPVSLGGLLNIIDGAASQEGRVMIMTTNYPKTLDSALIRPGRVDLQVEFTLATHDQIRDMYKCMYTEESSNSTRNTKPPETIQVDAHKSKAAWDDLCSDVCPYMTESSESQSKRLGKMAKMFADMLPEKVFSPAELQGFLLERKRNPEGALREVEKWRDERIKSMAEANKEAREP